MIRRTTLSIPVPNGPGVYIAVNYFAPLAVAWLEYSDILSFAHCLRRCADMYAVTAGEWTDEGIADIPINRCVSLGRWPLSLEFGNGSQFLERLAQAVYAHLGITKIATTYYQRNDVGGTHQGNHTMSHMLAVFINTWENTWNLLLHPNRVDEKSLRRCATGLAPNKVHVDTKTVGLKRPILHGHPFHTGSRRMTTVCQHGWIKHAFMFRNQNRFVF